MIKKYKPKKPNKPPASKVKKVVKNIAGKGSLVSLLAGAGFAASDIRDIVGGSISDKQAQKQFGDKSATAEQYRAAIAEGVKNLPSTVAGDPLPYIRDILLYSNPITAGLATMFTPTEVGSGTLDDYSPEELKALQKRVMKRKKSGGRVGKPKGVGAAKRGFGKAMKRG